MKKAKKLLGFTLIELLIVIAIIGVLAVAFLPTLLEAPAKGRDTSRIADLQKIQKVLVNANLEGKQYPTANADIAAGAGTGLADPNDTWSEAFGTSFGGTIPADPQTGKVYKYWTSPGDYSFGLSANVEVFENANALCGDELGNGNLGEPQEDGDPSTWCYAIFTQ